KSEVTGALDQTSSAASPSSAGGTTTAAATVSALGRGSCAPRAASPESTKTTRRTMYSRIRSLWCLRGSGPTRRCRSGRPASRSVRPPDDRRPANPRTRGLERPLDRTVGFAGWAHLSAPDQSDVAAEGLRLDAGPAVADDEAAATSAADSIG